MESAIFLRRLGEVSGVGNDLDGTKRLCGQFVTAIPYIGERGGVAEGINPSPQGLEDWSDWILRDSFSDSHALRHKASADYSSTILVPYYTLVVLCRSSTHRSSTILYASGTMLS